MSRLSPFAPIQPPPIDAPDNAAARQAKQPELGGRTGRQDPAWYLLNNSGYPNGNCADNPCGFPGYGSAYLGTYQVYRLIRDHPRVFQARQQIFATLWGNPWALMVREDFPKDAEKLVRDRLANAETISEYKREAFRACDYGHYAFEKVWVADKGKRWATLKPLLVDTTVALVEKQGDALHPKGSYAGCRWNEAKGDDFLTRRESLWVTFDGEAGYLYGRSWYENVRAYAWRDWLDAATQMQMTCLKIAGKLAIIKTPSGSYIDGNGNSVSWRDVAMAAGRAIADVRSNGTVWLPLAQLPEMLDKEAVDFAKIPLVEIKVEDFGSHADAIVGYLDRMRHAEDLMAAGLGRSIRTMMESKHGSRADSEQQTDNDTNHVQFLDGILAKPYNEQLIDDVVTTDVGEQYRGAVRLVPASLRDEFKAVGMKLLEWIFTNGDTADDAVEKMDTSALAERMQVPMRTINGKKSWDIRATAADGGKGDEMPNENGDDPAKDDTPPGDGGEE